MSFLRTKASAGDEGGSSGRIYSPPGAKYLYRHVQYRNILKVRGIEVLIDLNDSQGLI